MKNQVIVLLSLIFAFGCIQPSFAKIKKDSAYVVIDGDTLFMVKRDGSELTAKERVFIISSRIEKLLLSRAFQSDSLKIVEEDYDFLLTHAGEIVVTTRDVEASQFGLTALELAQQREEIVDEYLSRGTNLNYVFGILKQIGLTILVVLILYFLVKGINKLFSLGFDRIQNIGADKLKGIKFRNYEFLSPERELRLIQRALNIVKWVLVVISVYVSLPIIFSIFPDTQDIAETLFGYIWRPFKGILIEIWNFIPSLISIVVILVVTRYVIKFLKTISEEVQNEKLVLPGFYPDFARPTYNILKFLIYAFALIIIFPYLPGSSSPVFQGVSVFLGLLISLGSSTAISNLIAGLFITYMRAYKQGDRVKIGETVGDVIERTALVTRVRTIKNEIITIPNASILNGHTINYSSAAEKTSLILHTAITIGYDVPWRKVHELLIDAAIKCDGVVKDPKPFVLQTSLNDFYVTYEINAYTSSPKKSSAIYSNLHENIQDNFNDSNIEILSPHFRVNRGDSTTSKENKDSIS